MLNATFWEEHDALKATPTHANPLQMMHTDILHGVIIWPEGIWCSLAQYASASDRLPYFALIGVAKRPFRLGRSIL
jgi:hypothetical protein